jgi:hypothetical protein
MPRCPFPEQVARNSLAPSLLKQHPRKESIARKRKRAALNTEFLAETLAGASKVEKIRCVRPIEGGRQQMQVLKGHLAQETA